MIRIINADVIDGLRSLPEKSVHCVVTSPPYWGLRDYGIEGQIGLEPTPEAHFATFPEALVEPCIKAGTSERGCCSVCGAPWVRVVEKTQYQPEIVPIGVRFVDESRGDKTRKLSGPEYNKSVKKLSETWQPTCTCNAGPVPCVVLDPFGGSGTVAKVARDLNRDAILIEINPAYVEIARRKLRADEQLFENVKVITA